MSLNIVVLTGNLTRDPEAKHTPSGTAVTTFGIAVNRISKDEEGNYEVDFFNVVAWQKTAEYASNYLKKGKKVAVDGRLQTRSWTTEDGQKRSVVEIVAERIENLSPREEGEENGGGAEARVSERATKTAQSSRRPALSDDPLDETDPFADD